MCCVGIVCGNNAISIFRQCGVSGPPIFLLRALNWLTLPLEPDVLSDTSPWKERPISCAPATTPTTLLCLLGLTVLTVPCIVVIIGNH